jgi:hypothetical protein
MSDPSVPVVAEPVLTVQSPSGQLQRHPVRGGLFGLLLGLGVAIYLMIFSIAPLLEYTIPIVAVVGCTVLGVLWAYIAPAKKPRK